MRKPAQPIRSTSQPPALPAGRAVISIDPCAHLRSLPKPSANKPRAARGVTLLELLVVMLIMLMVTAAAIPVIAPAMQNRQMRESTRMVTSFIGAAKARAVQTGRPVGIVIERFNGLPYSTQMAQVEVPPPYSGDIVGSKATIAPFTPGATSKGRADAITPYQEWFTATISPIELTHQLVKIGDTIQLGSQGHIYTVLGPDETIGPNLPDGVCDNSTLEICYLSSTSVAGTVVFPWLNTAPAPQPATYQIFRQPVRTSTPAMQLPEGIVFDLTVSGLGTGKYNCLLNYGTMNLGDVPAQPAVRFNPMIIFSPSGRVEQASNNNGLVTRVTDPIYLLLGRRESMQDVTARGNDADIVFQNLSAIPPAASPGDRMPPAQNFWITIGPTSGSVSVAEVAPHMQDYKNATGNSLTNYQQVINLALWGVNPAGNQVTTGARTFARESQSLGGR